MTRAQGKTEQAALESVARKGFWIGRGKRAFDVAKGMQARNAIAGATYRFDAFNANGHRSQWHHPKFIPAYEVEINVQHGQVASNNTEVAAQSPCLKFGWGQCPNCAAGFPQNCQCAPGSEKKPCNRSNDRAR